MPSAAATRQAPLKLERAMQILAIAVALIVAYLIGSLSFAVIVSRAFGLGDPRSYGSGNPGATNVLRSGSRVAAAVTLALDALKGYVPVLLVLLLGPRFGLGPRLAVFAPDHARDDAQDHQPRHPAPPAEQP